MRASAFETIVPNAPITSLPAHLELTASRVSPILVITLALPVAIAALIPFCLIARHPEVLGLISRLETSIPLGLALIAWTALFGWPIATTIASFGRRRHISLYHGSIDVIDTNLLKQNAWSEPLSAYLGLAHHVRASLSGTRHELLLVHPDPGRSLMLHASATVSQREIDDMAHLLGCREIAPRVFYRKVGHKLAGIADTSPPMAVGVST